MPSCDVLIVGAGPTGLVLALRLARHGVRLRIVDKNSGPGQASRAMAVHARTLEFYDQLELANDVIGRGIRINRLHLRESGHERASVSFGDLGGDLSPFPFVLCFPQDDHERFLVERLAAAGVQVEWNTELKELTQSVGGGADANQVTGNDATASVDAVLQGTAGIEQVSARFVVGCDGAHSRVRQSLGLDFPGGTYEQIFYVADVKFVEDIPTDLFMNLADGGFVLTLPVRSSGMWRLIGTVPLSMQKPDLNFEDLRSSVEPVMGLKVADVHWFATYHVHHRVASKFRVGNVFIAGDAAHIHSPAGGQGMNTGIGDAVNLSWKLADVLQGRIAASVLATYEPERIAFARKLVATTDRAFQTIVNPGIAGQLLRRWVMPTLAPAAAGFEAVRRLIFKTVSQTRITYRSSKLSEGDVGEVQGGDRMPWVASDVGGNYLPLRSMDWQCHVYGEVHPEFEAEASTVHLPVHGFVYSDAARKAGIQEDAAYVLRPDGHVGLALVNQSPAALRDYASRVGLR
jgi:2-polyprenyl-6-methoxyphenol hydroxylase-like FAD-dependent oxidoreductase